MKKRNIAIGIFLIFAAVLLILGTTGVIKPLESTLGTFTAFEIIAGIFLLVQIIEKIIRRQFWLLFLFLAIFFVIFEENIAFICGLESENIINNWFVIIAALVADSAFNYLVPKKNKKGHSNTFSSSVHYIDASNTTVSHVYNRMGNSDVYYQNTEFLDPETKLELNLSNKMGNITVYVPNDWVVVDKMSNNMGNIEVREGVGGSITLTLFGENKMGNIEIVSE